MNRIPQLLFSLLLITLATDSMGQGRRYLEPIFAETDLQITRDVTYGVNITQLTPSPSRQTLKLDLYQPPASDTVSQRPLIIYLHTGNFLPPVTNGSPVGNKGDSTAVAFCTQWAMRGYVAACIDYRLGWNPVTPNADTRKSTLLQAVYRALQDTRNAVRFFRNGALNLSNPYHINEAQISVFGEGSGGYVALAVGSLDNFSKISSLPKFRDANTNLPYVDATVNGDINGFGGDTTSQNLDNYPGVSSAVHFIINAGGALADTSWLSAGQAPVISFQTVRDPFAPYGNGTVIVPTTNENVVDVSGAGVFMKIVNDLHNNDAFASFTFSANDPETAAARSRYNLTVPYILPSPFDQINTGSGEGLMNFLLPLASDKLKNQASPWQFWDQNSTAAQTIDPTSNPPSTTNANSLASNPDMSPVKARIYIDSMQRYMLPRLMITYQLPGYQTVGIQEAVVSNSQLAVYPNPASSSINVVVKNNALEMQTITLTDVTGKVVMSENASNGSNHTIQRNGMSPGIYLVNVRFKSGEQTNTKVVFE